jgi:hypothetical protein
MTPFTVNLDCAPDVGDREHGENVGLEETDEHAEQDGPARLARLLLRRLAREIGVPVVPTPREQAPAAVAPEPVPKVLVGVFTLTKIIFASFIPRSISVEKKRFLPRVAAMISSSPGS